VIGKLALVVGLLLLLVVGSGFWAGAQTLQAFKALKAGQLEKAAESSQKALPIVSLFSILSFHQVPDLEVWHQGLKLLSDAPVIKTALSQSISGAQTPNSPDPNPLSTPTPSLKSLATQVITLSQLYQKTWLLQRFTTTQQAQITQATDRLEIIRDHLLTGDHNLILLFQNSHELRATGGFTGSYALLQLSEGQIKKLEIFDIYQPDGQFTGFVTAPTGVAEYLSSGNGLRLPDANWWPDFPTSAQKILAFFALGKTQTIDGVVAINLELVIDLLKITGPVYLPDLQTEITPDNIAQVLRSNREDFFPGSVAKQHLLSRFFTQLKLKIPELALNQQLEIGQLLLESLPLKNLQIYSSIPELEVLSMQVGAAGLQESKPDTQPLPPDLYFFPVESNVGINKANQAITRKFALDLKPTQARFQIEFTNQNLAPTAYVNYQRLFILPNTTIKNITYQGQTVTKWDEEVVTAANGETFKQIGFLLTLPAQQTALLSFEVTHLPLPSQPTIMFQKQAGLPSTPLEISHRGANQKLEIIQDTWISLTGSR